MAMATEVEHPLALRQMPQSTVSTPESSSSTSPTGMMHDTFKNEPSIKKEKENTSPSSVTSSGKPHSTTSSTSRRPPRKSTLTQQQKNQKRQRATQDQLATLEMEFNKNPTPTAGVRDRIAMEINMTERSVQIWFQNRRAKIKLLAKKSLETGEDIDSIPESMRNYLAMQAMESGKGIGAAFIGRTGLIPYGASNMMLGGEQGGQGKVLIHHLTCRSLNIGTWTRVGQNTMDLIIFYSPDKCTMTYYINNDQAGYKIEYPFAFIKSIFLENPEGDPNKVGGIVIELSQPPFFFMDSNPAASGFRQCGDFTEDQQGSKILVHHLGGNPKVLSGQLAKLVSLESFMNRHNSMPFVEQHQLSISAPVSPTARPSSQPNFAQPHVGMFQESWGIGNIPLGMRGPGHKRQRSRSVPMAVDFSMLQTPMPSFYIQQPGEVAPQPASPAIFAPVPQQPGGLGPNLRIDTQAGFGLDMRQYPVSATTASPSDFSSPNFFSQAPEGSTPLPASSYNTPYSSAFLSPMVNPATLIPPSVSPLSFASHQEPSIVEYSPPLDMLGRPASADVYANECAISDDGHDMMSPEHMKHAMNLVMRKHSPGLVEHAQAELDMSQLVQFDHVDPSSLSPESLPNMAPQ